MDELVCLDNQFIVCQFLELEMDNGAMKKLTE